MRRTRGRYHARRGGFYWTCPICGANLDAGERCTCEDETKEAPLKESSGPNEPPEAPSSHFKRASHIIYP